MIEQKINTERKKGRKNDNERKKQKERKKARIEKERKNTTSAIFVIAALVNLIWDTESGLMFSLPSQLAINDN